MKPTRDDFGALIDGMELRGGGSVSLVGCVTSKDPIVFQMATAERGVSILLSRDEALQLSRLLADATFVKLPSAGQRKRPGLPPRAPGPRP